MDYNKSIQEYVYELNHRVTNIDEKETIDRVYLRESICKQIIKDNNDISNIKDNFTEFEIKDIYKIDDVELIVSLRFNITLKRTKNTFKINNEDKYCYYIGNNPIKFKDISIIDANDIIRCYKTNLTCNISLNEYIRESLRNV